MRAMTDPRTVSAFFFSGNARGSNCEVQTQLIIAKELEFGSVQSRQLPEGLSEEISKMLVSMMTKLRRRLLLFGFLFPVPCFSGPETGSCSTSLSD